MGYNFSSMEAKKLTHLDDSGQARMVDVGAKPESERWAVARGEVFKHPIFAELGAVYKKTPGQIVLRWIWQKGVVVNTMSTNPDNIRANWEITDFALSDQDIAKIDALGSVNYRVVTIDKVPWAPDWD